MRSRIWNHIIPLVGDVALKDIDAAVLRAWKAQLLTRVDESTAEVIWIHLSTILAAAVDDGRLLKNPCKSHRTVKPPKRAESKAKAWDRPTTDAVRASLQERYRLAVGLGVGAGLRQGEAFGLGEDDIDEDASVIRVRRQLRWDHRGRPYFCLPKGKKAREVPLSPALVRRARARMARFPTVACTLPWRDPEPPTTELEARQCKPITVPLVLNTSHGKRINYATFNDRSWKRALAAAGVITVVDQRVEKFGGRVRQYPVYEPSRQDMFHVLRHTYASVQLEAGESIVSLSTWLGHASPKITLDHYAHFMPQAGNRGLAAMDSWLVVPKPRKVPEKSPGSVWDLAVPVFSQVSGAGAEGADMKVKYKETSRGGLAVNVIEC